MDRVILKRKLEYINHFDKNINIMEVCGTHTMAIGRHGIRELLPENVKLLSGPGCPVCVTPDYYIDYIYDLAVKQNCIIATYGDMIRVPGSQRNITLERAKAQGAAVRMVYSSIDAIKIAQENKGRKVVFLGIGFETTAPATALAVTEALKAKVDNFYVLSMHKRIEPIMHSLLKDKELKIDGFLCPGHVGVIIGQMGFQFLEEYGCASAIAGFEADEVIDGLFSIIKDISEEDYSVKNVYNAVVKREGNAAAQAVISQYFEEKDDYWRGIGKVPSSGYKLKEKFSSFAIEKLIPISTKETPHSSACQCGEVLKGKIKPENCPLFAKVCCPENPVGPCMVSGEGSCAARFKYGSF